MSPTDVVRILATNDLCSRVAPEATSFGTLPGLAGIRRTADDLRTPASLWLDAGDFAGWSPLGSLTGGEAAFAAAAELPFDATCPGNHELDWGLPRFQQFARVAPYPVVCANIDLGLAPTVTLTTPAGPVGIIGLTAPEVVRADDPPPAERITTLAASLRAAGCVLVVALVHDGVDWRPTAPLAPTATRFRRDHEGWLAAVDLVIAGHTLSHWAAALPGGPATPVVQPWAFGAEIAVVDMPVHDPAGATIRRARPSPGPAYEGPGAAVLAEAAAVHHGCLRVPAVSGVSGERESATLPRMLAYAMRVVTASDAALLPAPYCTTQPAIDGVFGWLGPGPVTELDLHRVAPYADGIVTTPLTAEEWHDVWAAFTPPTRPPSPPAMSGDKWWHHYPLASGLSQRSAAPDPLTLATVAPFAEPVTEIVGRELVWTDTGHYVKHAVAELLHTVVDIDPRMLT